jgi:hypothetical protein
MISPTTPPVSIKPHDIGQSVGHVMLNSLVVERTTNTMRYAATSPPSWAGPPEESTHGKSNFVQLVVTYMQRISQLN